MNNGLSHRFNLVNGKFNLTQGASKTKDGLYFLFCFHSIARIYRDSFSPRALNLIQKTGSYVLSYKPLILGRLRAISQIYVPNIRIDAIDFFVSRGVDNGNSTELVLTYKYIGDDNTVETDTLTKII